MAHKVRHALSGETTIMFDRLEMVKLERLLKILTHDGDTIYLGPEEEKWLENALELFKLEPPSGEYKI